MPRGNASNKSGGRGGKRSHKGQRRQFTEPDELKAQAEKAERERQWRKQQGIDSDEEEKTEKTEDGEAEAAAKSGSDASGSESESSEEEDSGKAKGVEHLIEVENPNRMGGKRNKKVTEIGDAPAAATGLSRREREEIEKQEAKRRYQQMHLAGKTDEAQADLARLAIIRKQREEAARKKEEERKARDEAATKSKGKS